MLPSPFKTKPTSRMLRQFAAGWLVFFLLIGASQIWRRGNITCGCVIGAMALVVGLLGLIKPGTMRLLFLVTSVAAYPIGWVVSFVMLGVMFYGVVTPVAFVFRLRGRDLLQLRSKTDQSSFWISRDAQPAPEQYLKQF